MRDPKSKSPTPIVCIVEYDGKPVIKLSTGLKILPSKWNASNEKPVGGLKGLDTESAENINDRIKQIKQEVESQYKGYLREFNQYPDKKDFKSSVVKALSGEVTNDGAVLKFLNKKIIRRWKTDHRASRQLFESLTFDNR